MLLGHPSFYGFFNVSQGVFNRTPKYMRMFLNLTILGYLRSLFGGSLRALSF